MPIKGKTLSKSHKANLSKSLKGRTITRKELGQTMRQTWVDPNMTLKVAMKLIRIEQYH